MTIFFLKTDWCVRHIPVTLYEGIFSSSSLKAGSHIVVSGRFGSSQMVGTTLDDREDYMETTPRRPRTTDDPGHLR